MNIRLSAKLNINMPLLLNFLNLSGVSIGITDMKLNGNNQASDINRPEYSSSASQEQTAAEVKIKARESCAEKKSGKHTDERKRVLFMDDELLIAMTTENILSKAGFDVSLASEGAAAVDIFIKAIDEGNPFSLVILDLNVAEGMGGEETVRSLLKINPDTKAVVTSGYLNDKVMSDCNKYGFIDSLPKPYTGEDLIEIVSKNI